MKNKYILTIVLFFLASLGAGATLTEEASKAYEEQNYREAIELYKTAVDSLGATPAILYNLGNAYYQASELGEAMLCYERAYKMDPSEKKIRENLLFLKTKIEDANRAEQKGKKLNVEVDEPTFFQNIHNAIAVEIHSDRWAVWGVISFLLFLFCVGLYVFTTRVSFRKTGFFGGFLLLGVTVICIIFACIGASQFNNREEGVLVAYKTELLEEPSGNTAGTVLTRGTKVRVIAEETDASGQVTWYKIRLNSNYIGWVKATDLEMI